MSAPIIVPIAASLQGRRRVRPRARNPCCGAESGAAIIGGRFSGGDIGCARLSTAELIALRGTDAGACGS
jgi:hypothetical protein